MQLVVDISRAFTQKQFTACVSKHTCRTYRLVWSYFTFNFISNSVPACYFKTFWLPWTKMNIILFLFLVNLLYVCVFQCEGKEYNHKSDMWALGCILYEMASRQKTFEGSNLPALVNKIMKVQENSDLVKFSRLYSQLINLSTCAKNSMTCFCISGSVCTNQRKLQSGI